MAGFGVAFLFLGILLLFDKGLLAIGNVSTSSGSSAETILLTALPFQILFLCGLACVIGLDRTFRFFFQKHKLKGSIAFFGGIIVVLVGFPLIGMIIESYGFFLLFSGFFPAAINFLRRVPVLGTFLNMPGVSRVMDKLAGDSNRTRV